jgi:iron complex outermembrane receptor protein
MIINRKMAGRLIWLAGFGAVVYGLPAVGFAQANDAENPTDQVGIDEIIVTATKRGGINAQDIGAGITAFDESKLEQLGALDFDEFIVHVPGTNFIDNGGPGRGHEVASIRGLSPVGDNTTSVVSEYLDGAPRFGRNYRLFDIGEVAVLRGPQGTLWGSQAVGGLISYRSNRPNFDGFSAKVVGDTYATSGADQSYRLSAAVNIPVVDDVFAVRFAAHNIEESGYVDNNIVGETKINDVSELAWRLSALWTPSDNLSLTFIYHGNDLETDAPTFFNVGAGERVSTDPYTDLRGTQDFDLFNFIAEAEFDWATVSYNASRYEMDNVWDDVERGVFGFIPVGRTVQTTKDESWTHEFRLASNSADSRFHWIVGLYSDDYDTNELGTQIEVPDPNDPEWVAAVFEGFEISVIGGPETFDEKAVFGELSFDFSDKLTGLFGARYFDWTVGNDQELTFFGGNFNQVTGEVGDSDSFFKVQLDYRPTDDTLIYVTRGEGFRFGGFNPFVGLEGIGESELKFEPDTLTNYEIGLKSSWMDNRLIFNAAVYKGDWDDVQVVVRAAPPSPWAYTDNGGELETKGVELEFVSQDLLAPGVYLSASYTYNTNEFKTDADPNSSGNPLIQKGDKLRRSPKNTWALDIGYDFAIGNNDAFVRANYWHKDKTSTEGFNGGDGIIDIAAQDVVNASMGMVFGSWAAKLYAENLTDEIPFLQVIPNSGDPTLAARASSIRPRTIGLEVTYRFE